jgi:glucosamine-6-phosphate deaminase
VYRDLIRRHRQTGLSFAAVQAFLLDDYVGLPPSHPQSYANVIRAEFTDHVDIDSGRVHSPNGVADDIFVAATEYDALIADVRPVDVQLLGIGGNGHIGFNEPGSSLGSRTRVKTLTEQTRRDNARFFTSADEVPRHVITQGLGTICDARHLVLIATGSHKAEAVAAAVEARLPQAAPRRSSNSIRTSRSSSTRRRPPT